MMVTEVGYLPMNGAVNEIRPSRKHSSWAIEYFFRALGVDSEGESKH